MVVDDPKRAAQLCAQGHDIVLLVAPGAPPAAPGGPGRLAVFVGHPDDPAARAGAAEMDAELFGPSGSTSSPPGSSPPGPAPA